MAGSFGYEERHYEISMKMAELDLLPAVRQADPDAWIVADGTSCRSQILHGTGRQAVHVARVLEAALAVRRADGQTGRRADGRTGGRADGRTGGWADGRTDR